MNPVTTSDLLDSVLAGATAVGGPGGDPAEVSAVAVWEPPETTTFTAVPGSAVLLVPPPAPSYGGPLTEVLIRRAAAAGAVLVVLVGDDAVPLSTRRLAGQLGIIVAAAPPGLGAVNLASALRTAIDGIVRADADVLVRLAEQALEAPDAAAVVALLAQALDCDAALVSAERGVLAGTLAPAGLSAIPYGDIETAGVASLLRAGAGEPLRLVAVRPDSSQRWRRLARQALAVVSGAIIAAEARSRLAQAQLRSSVERVMSEILQGPEHLAAATAESAARLGIAVSGWHIGLECIVTGAAPPLAALDVMAASVGSDGEMSPWLSAGGGSVGWLTTAAPPTATLVRAITAHLSQAAADVRHRWPGSRAFAGVGAAGPDPAGIARSVGQAHQAALVASSGGPGEAVRVVHDLGASRLLLGWYGSGVFRDVADDILGPLLAAGDPELIRTVAAYLDRACSASHTARALGLHRNTVSQRIGRAEHALGVSFTDPDTRLALQLALRAHNKHA